MSSLLIYKGMGKSRDDLKIGDKVKIIDGFDILDREFRMFPVGTIGTIIETCSWSDDFDFRVEGYDKDGWYDTWLYSKEQLEPVEEDINE